MSFSLSSEDVEKLKKAVRDCDFLSLPQSFLGGHEISKGAYVEGGPHYWAIFFEIDDGTVVTYSSNTIELPDQVSAFEDVMREYWIQAYVIN